VGAQLMSCYHKSLRSADVVDGKVGCKDCGKQWSDVDYIGTGLDGSLIVVTKQETRPLPNGKCWLSATLGGCPNCRNLSHCRRLQTQPTC
jgi:hypothetical protein